MPNRVVAITGGIGSGKSSVLSILASLGAYTLSADDINRELLLTPSYVAGLKDLFPSCVVDGVVNKPLLKQLVFSNELERKKLNQYAHPRIIQSIKERVAKVAEDVFVEMPLLVESDAVDMFDYIWVVVSNSAIDRATVRDKDTKNVVKKVASSQASDEDRLSIADVVIDNNGTLKDLEMVVGEVYQNFINER